jgi:hypothetical protein
MAETVCANKGPTYLCTREANHPGPHQAECGTNIILDEWTDQEMQELRKDKPQLVEVLINKVWHKMTWVRLEALMNVKPVGYTVRVRLPKGGQHASG